MAKTNYIGAFLGAMVGLAIGHLFLAQIITDVAGSFGFWGIPWFTISQLLGIVVGGYLGMKYFKFKWSIMETNDNVSNWSDDIQRFIHLTPSKMKNYTKGD